MAKVIWVNRAQVRAARLLVKRAERGIGEASPAIRAIANARPAPQPDEATCKEPARAPRD